MGLAKPNKMLWQKLFDSGSDPLQLKGDLVYPNHTSQLSLVFERYVKVIKVNRQEQYELLGDHQFGFRKKRSCMSQLLRLYNNMLNRVCHNT